MSGISGKAEIEEDEEAADTAMAETSRRALVEVLGAERRDRILSALYLARQDAVSVVRQSSAHIWKALVHNTPRTGTLQDACSGRDMLTHIDVVREILPELMNQIISLLAGPEIDQQEVRSSERNPCMSSFTWYNRRLGEQSQSCAASLAKRSWERSSPS